MFVVIVTEAPRTGQRRARVYRWAVPGATEVEARAAWARSHESDIYGTEPQDRTEFEPHDGRPYALR